MTTEMILQIAGFLITSAVIGSIISAWTKTRLSRKKLVAEATRSALRRVEMYYRVLRRTNTDEDKIGVRDAFHIIQEDNDYYRSLLSIESVWLGYRYSQFIEAIKRETEPLIQSAWKEKPYGPGGELKNIKHPQVDKYIVQFATDSRKLFNPISRAIMRLKHILKKWVDSEAYG